tara:strand:+ start:4043 stop:6205 length:2163 start_codon:yes stop_codon:yes gene_type:complete
MESYDIKKMRFKSKNEPEIEEKLTGKVITQLEDQSKVQPNAELEGKEYIQFPDGTTQLVVGNSHAKSGVKMNIPDGSRIVSTSLNFSAKQAKQLNDEYGLSISKKDTYANGINKYVKKIGLDALYKEEEELYTLIKKEVEKKDVEQSTKLVNQEYLSGKVAQIQGQKEGLEELKSKFFSVVFDMQEESKAEGSGGKSKDGELKYGGVSEQDFKKLCKDYGISEKHGKSLVRGSINSFESGGDMPKYPHGGEHDDDKEVLAELRKKYDTKPKIEVAREEGFLTDAQMNILMGEFYSGRVEGVDYDSPAGSGTRSKSPYGEKEAYTQEGIDRLNTFNNKYGLSKVPDGASKEEIDNAAGELQDYMKKNHPELVYNYMMTKSHQPNNKLKEKLKTINKARIAAGETAYPITNKGLDQAVKDKNLTKANVIEGYRDNKWWYRALDIKEESIPRSEYDKLIKREGSVKEGDNLYFSENADNPEEYTMYTPIDDEKEEEVVVVDEEEEEDFNPNIPKGYYPRLFGAPNQYPSPPFRMDAHLLGESRAERMDPVRIGIEPQIQEAGAQREFVAEQMFGNLAPNVAGSVMATLMGNQTKAINAEARNANMINAQNQASTELFNIGQSWKENEANLRNKLSFEARTYTALGNYQEEFKRWEDQLTQIGINNYKNDQAFNLMNQMFDNYNVDSGGNKVDYDGSDNFKVNSAMNEFKKTFKYDPITGEEIV